MAILAIAQPIYQPAMRIINSITQANNAVVTTSFAHDYRSGDIVRIIIPSGYGMTQLNDQQSEITVTGDTTFTLNIDTSDYDAFVVPATFPLSYQHAQVVPIGEINSTLLSAVKNVLPY